MSIVLSREQEEVKKKLIETKNHLSIQATAGCLAPGTLILMYNGSLKKVEDIIVGDEVMGSDSSPRCVLNTTHGESKMYKINPIKGESWICNDEHILTVYDHYRHSNNRVKSRNQNPIYKDPIIDISVIEALKRKKNQYNPTTLKCLKLIRTGVDFKEQFINIDPYVYGMWLGDGNCSGPQIWNIDPEIITFFDSFRDKNVDTKRVLVNDVWRISLNAKFGDNFYREELKKSIVNKEKRIIPNYLINSKLNRLKLLAGLIDSDGYVKNNCVYICTKWEGLRDDILFLCRSLGFSAVAYKRTRSCKEYNFVGEYWDVSISGNLFEIPTLILRKKFFQRLQIKSVLRTGFGIEEIGFGKYYGFTVDKDQRFLLGDFTITHNSGKTTLLLELLNYVPKLRKTLFTSFANAIVDELKERVPSHIKATTLHSQGWLFVRRRYTSLVVNKDKYFQGALASYTRSERTKDVYKECFRIQDICQYARLTLTPFEIEPLKELCTYYSIDADSKLILKAINLLKQYTILEKQKEVDFTDMVYFPAVMPELVTDKYNYVFLDEAQDTNKCQLQLVNHLLLPGGRLISCGDNCQTIYGFAGNDIDSFKRIQQRPDTITLPLKETYRCPIEGVKLAQSVYPDVIKAHPNAIQGKITRGGSLLSARPGDMIISRNTAPLISAFFHLVDNDIKSYVVGKDLEKGVVSLAENVMGGSRDQVKENLDRKMKSLEKELINDGIDNPTSHPKYQSFLDKREIILIILRKVDSVVNLVPKIQEIFHEDKKAVKLTSAHRCKGLECDKVFFIERFNGKQLIPSEHAKQDWEKLQEKNLLFVVYTRWKKEFVFIDFKD